MTWAIDAVLAAVLVGLVWLGAKRGLMKSLAGVISVGAAFFGASWCANRFVTPVSRWLEPLLRESIQQKLSGRDGADAGELLSACSGIVRPMCCPPHGLWPAAATAIPSP